MTIVAAARSRHGGICQGCDRRIARGEQIFKWDVGDRGSTTSYGNGPGIWICATCAAFDESDRPE